FYTKFLALLMQSNEERDASTSELLHRQENLTCLLHATPCLAKQNVSNIYKQNSCRGPLECIKFQCSSVCLSRCATVAASMFTSCLCGAMIRVHTEHISLTTAATSLPNRVAQSEVGSTSTLREV